MKGLRKTRFFLIEHLNNKKFIHQKTYIKKSDKIFLYGQTSYVVPPDVRLLDLDRTLSDFEKRMKKIFGQEIRFFSQTLMYLIKYTHHDISIFDNLLVIYNSSLTQRCF